MCIAVNFPARAPPEAGLRRSTPSGWIVRIPNRSHGRIRFPAAARSPELLHPDTIAALRTALVEQRAAGPDPLPNLSAAVERAAREARARGLRPEALIIQLKELAEKSEFACRLRGLARARFKIGWSRRA